MEENNEEKKEENLEENNTKSLFGIKVEDLDKEKEEKEKPKEFKEKNAQNNTKNSRESFDNGEINDPDIAGHDKGDKSSFKKTKFKKLPKTELNDKPKKNSTNFYLGIACLVVFSLIIIVFLVEFHNKDFSTSINLTNNFTMNPPINNINTYPTSNAYFNATINNTSQNNITVVVNIDLHNLNLTNLS